MWMWVHACTYNWDYIISLFQVRSVFISRIQYCRVDSIFVKSIPIIQWRFHFWEVSFIMAAMISFLWCQFCFCKVDFIFAKSFQFLHNWFHSFASLFLNSDRVNVESILGLWFHLNTSWLYYSHNQKVLDISFLWSTPLIFQLFHIGLFDNFKPNSLFDITCFQKKKPKIGNRR